MTLDDTCITDDGKLISGPFSAKPLPVQPLCYQTDINRTSPICSTCRHKSYTRTYCRNLKSHKQLPWSTVYVQLSSDPNGVVEDQKEPSREGKSKRAKVTVQDQEGDKQDDHKTQDLHTDTTKTDSDTVAVEGPKQGADTTAGNNKSVGGEMFVESAENIDLENIGENRTLLATVSSKGITLEVSVVRISNIFRDLFRILHPQAVHFIANPEKHQWVDVDPGLSMTIGPNFLMPADEARAQAMGWSVDFMSSRFHPSYPFPMNPNMAYAMSERSSMMPPFFPQYPPERRSSGVMQSTTAQDSNSAHSQGHSSTLNTRNGPMDRPMMGHSMQNMSYDRSMASHLSSGNPDDRVFPSSQNPMNYPNIPPWMQGQYEENAANMFFPPWYNAYMSHMQGGSPPRASNRDNGPSEFDPRYQNNNSSSRDNSEHEYYYQNRS